MVRDKKMQIIKICKSLKNRTNISSLPHLCDLRIAVLQQFGVPSPIHSSVGRKTTSLLPIQKCPFVFVFSSYLSYFCVTPLKNTKRKRSSIQFEWTTASSIIQICGYHKSTLIERGNPWYSLTFWSWQRKFTTYLLLTKIVDCLATI